MATHGRYAKPSYGIPLEERLASMELWRAENAETNDEQLKRITRNLKKIILNELTPTQRDYLIDIYFRGMRVTDIALKYGVSKSSVSRTLRRARERLERHLKYSF